VVSIITVLITVITMKVDPYHHDMTSSWVARGDKLRIWKVAENILNK